MTFWNFAMLIAYKVEVYIFLDFGYLLYKY